MIETSRLKETWETHQRQRMKFLWILNQANCKQKNELVGI